MPSFWDYITGKEETVDECKLKCDATEKKRIAKIPKQEPVQDATPPTTPEQQGQANQSGGKRYRKKRRSNKRKSNRRRSRSTRRTK
jgi:hypothetical protein